MHITAHITVTSLTVALQQISATVTVLPVIEYRNVQYYLKGRWERIFIAGVRICFM